MYVLRLIGIFLFGMLLIPLITSAIELSGGDPLSISIEPAYPKPFEEVTVIPSSTLINPANHRISIFVDGTKIEEGSGKITASTIMGEAGKPITIRVVASSGASQYEETLTVRPASVALITEPVSTTQAFYGGAPLVASEGRVRLIATPNFAGNTGVPIDPKTLAYTWKKGERLLESESGIGRSVLVTTAPIRYRDTRATVTVTNIEETMIAQAHVLISPVDPVVRVYEHDPLLGILSNRAFSGSFEMEGEEKTFRAVPFYMSDNPSITWTINGNEGGRAFDLTVRASGTGKGTALVNVTARKDGDIIQSAVTSLSVMFGTASSGIFTL